MRKGLQRDVLQTAVIALLAITLTGAVAVADQLVDPSKVPPEFRAAAEKRRAEQLAIINCNSAAKLANITARDMTKYLAECIDKRLNAPSDVSATRK